MRLPFYRETIMDEKGTPYMRRFLLGKAGHFRLHIFERGDNDPDLHDHPWDFITFPLTSYVEVYATRADKAAEYGYQLTRVVKRFRFHYRSAETAHRVVGKWNGYQRVHPQQTAENISVPGRIYTLVFAFSKRRKWGFHTLHGWIPWRQYVKEPLS